MGAKAMTYEEYIQKREEYIENNGLKTGPAFDRNWYAAMDCKYDVVGFAHVIQGSLEHAMVTYKELGYVPVREAVRELICIWAKKP